jgi:hypothetical protein
VGDLFLAHLVRDDEGQLIALLRGHQRQSQPGVAGRGLDQRGAGTQFSLPLGGGDHGKGDAVLDRAAGVLVLKF